MKVLEAFVMFLSQPPSRGDWLMLFAALLMLAARLS